MSYIKWVANLDRHNDGTTEEILADGTVVRMGEPVQLNADQRKAMEASGRVFEDSSAEEAKEQAAQQSAEQPVGADVVGTAPLLGSNVETDQPSESSGKSDKK
jgi:hypothetical protein